jgi:hypothetical protein
MKIEVQPTFTIKKIYHKVKSRWKDRSRIEWEEEEMNWRKIWGEEGRLDWEEQRIWKDGMRFILITVMKEDQSPWEEPIAELQAEPSWENFLKGDKWKQIRWNEWLEDNPAWMEEWEEPREWLAGETE